MKRIKRYLATHCWLCGKEYDWNYSICVRCSTQARRFQRRWIREIIHERVPDVGAKEDWNLYKPAKIYFLKITL